MMLAGEGVGILNLMQNVKQRAVDIKGGELVTHSDNKFLIKNVIMKLRNQVIVEKRLEGG